MEIERLTEFEEVISPELIKEFCGFDSDLDASQELVISTLTASAIEAGEQYTGIFWRRAKYSVKKLHPEMFTREICVPVSPALEAFALFALDKDGNETELDPDSWEFVPSAIEFGRPWGFFRSKTLTIWPSASCFRAEVFVGWDKTNFPESLKGWLLNRIASSYDVRGDQGSGRSAGIEMARSHSRVLLDRFTVRGFPHDA